MFIALIIKEWREKALVFLFELGVLAVLLGASTLLREKRDVQEWLLYAILLLFFPFAALVLGAAGFEAEHRQGAWAYLFSRPVNRTSVWLAKMAALLGLLTVLWLVFLAAWAAFPAIRGMIAGPQLLLSFAASSGFPWWSAGLSLFFLVVAFSLSPLQERQFNTLFVSVAAGLLFPAAVRLFLVSKAGGFLGLVAPSRALTALILSLTLIALAFAAASVLTLARSDFSQPRKRAAVFARRLTLFLVVAIAATAVWIRFGPVPGERYLYRFEKVAGEPYYLSNKGVFKYSESKNRVQWLVKAKQAEWIRATSGGGRTAYSVFSRESRHDVSEELWVADADGRGRRRIIGRGPGAIEWPGGGPITDLRMSPDGSRIAILSSNAYGSRSSGRKESSPLWIINTDGTGLENAPDDPLLFGSPKEQRDLRILAWAGEGKSVLLLKQVLSKPTRFSLWLYDFSSRLARLVLDNAVPASWLAPFYPGGGALAVRRSDGGSPWRLALLDLKTLVATDIPVPTIFESAGSVTQFVWDLSGDRFAYVRRGARPDGSPAYLLAVYSLSEQRIVAERPLTASESVAQLLSPTWLPGHRGLLVLFQDDRTLKVLGPDLLEVETIAIPRWLERPEGLSGVGDKALISDGRTDTLWRLDLGTKRWKRLY